MSDELARLERRVAVLEEMLRRLLAAGAAPEHVAPPPEPRRSPVSELRVQEPSPYTRPSPRRSPPSGSPSTQDLEQWFGQRGLLFVGVLALLTAAGFFLKYAIDRGWIPPALRAALAITAGVGVATWGEGRLRAGLRGYGAAMIGAGGGLAYLGLWAAAGPYGLIERRIGVLLLAACTVVVILLALRHEIEGLALWALAGAYLAPILLAPAVPNPEAFLGYLEVIGLGAGLLAYSMAWRRAYDLALAGYFLLAAAGASRALASAVGCWFLAAGALLTLHVTRRRAWPEARIGALVLTWILAAVALATPLGGPETRRWLALAALFAVAGLLWWQGLAEDPLRSPTEALLFVANPFVLVALTGIGDPPGLARVPSLLPALLAVAYGAPGWARRTAPHFVLGVALAAYTVAVQWPPATVVLGWTALCLLALVAEREAGRPGGRLAALGLAVLAFGGLFSVALWSRPSDSATFADAWALALYGYVIGTAAAAARWGSGWADPRLARWTARGGELAWVLCGAAVFVGGSVELQRYFGPRSPLASDLALSVFWLLYAGALVRLGFQRDRKDVRSAGLAVAAAAGLKIVVYDLSTLEALYRIASFFALALIALALAYTYNRRAASSRS